MRDHLLTFLFLLAAFALYFLGMALPAGILNHNPPPEYEEEYERKQQQ